MRLAILIMLLVGAAFLGGACATGPGLHWVQARILQSVGLHDAGEFTAVDMESHSSSETTSTPRELGRSKANGSAGLITRISRLESEGECSKPGVFDGPLISQRRVECSDHSLGSDQSRSFSVVLATAPQSVTKPSAGSPAPVDPRFALENPNPPSRPIRSALQADELAAPGPLDSPAAVTIPAKSPTKIDRALSTRQLPRRNLSGTIGYEWTQLENRMQTLGISRFTVEGMPGGYVVCTCLIPLVGQQAVTQRFEADGEDVLQTAKTVLRRVVLWRSIQLPSDNKVHQGEKE